VQATALLVTPPDETGPIRTGALGLVCEQGRIQQTAYTVSTTPLPPTRGRHSKLPIDA